jgi:thymidylate kinase
VTTRLHAPAPAAGATANLPGAVFGGLDRAAVRWCLLRRPEDGGPPGGEGGDIDLLVARADLARAEAVLRACGTVPLAAYGRGGHRFFLGLDPATGAFVELDVATELAYGRHFAVRTRTEDACLARRRRDGTAWVLRPEDDFWALLLHCALDKRAVPTRHAKRLARLAGSASLDSPLVRAWPGAASRFAGLLGAARAGDWTAVVGHGDALGALWRRTHRLEVSRASVQGTLLRAVERPLQAWGRRGLSVALLGPDGAGKSTLADGIAASFHFPVRRVYMGLWRRREATSGAHRVALEVALRPLVVWRRYLASLGHRALGRLVVFDRYVYDALVPPAPPLAWLKRPYFRLLSRLCPAPNLVLVLDVPGRVMYLRKGEHDPRRLEADRAHFARLLPRLPNAERVDADRPAEVVLADVVGRIWRRYAARSGQAVAR